MKQIFAKKPLSLLLEEMKGENRLRRILGPITLTSLGVGAIIGTGIFVLTGKAALTAGPGVMLSFVFAGIACVFAAFCYAEFASMVPVAGSAYTYAYATLGELFAWIIGWDLVLEYAVGSAAVANGWSSYFQEFIDVFGLKLPDIIAKAPITLVKGHLIISGGIVNLPAVIITFIVTVILIIGIKESARFNATMVITKLFIVIFVIVVGAFYIKTSNWSNFTPFGLGGLTFFGTTIWGEVSNGLGGVQINAPMGVLAAAAVVFFAYIGFDSVSTHAEEAKNPRKDVPIGIIASLLICTVLYIVVAAVLTGMVPYDKISVDAPVANAFKQVGLGWAQLLISIGAVAGITSVLLVMMLSQPRVLLAMARDGLVPPSIFAAVHEKFRTPWKSTIATGIFVATLSGFLPLDVLAELVNIGTLFAFVVVCTAVLIMRRTHPEAERPYKAPFFPAVPILGIVTCLILMFSLALENWIRLFIWLGIGMLIYVFYGRHHSVMHKLMNKK